jgi:protocatechuate 3,4-dioxygenase beta subunit
VQLGSFWSWRRKGQDKIPAGPHRKGRSRRNLRPAEALESRRLMAADIKLGSVYYEEASGFDDAPDRLEFTFNGGAPGTQLTKLTLDMDKNGNGTLDNGETFFDIAPGGRGAFNSVGWVIAGMNGIDTANVQVVDGSMKLEITFTGFDAGEKFVLTLDVDESGFRGDNAVAEGNEFEASRLTGEFTAPHYYTAIGTDEYWDAYDSKLTGSGLNLPPDDYIPPDAPAPVRTAGAIFAIPQVPLPITLKGTVYDDLQLNGVRDGADPGIGGVQVSLLVLTNGTYTVSQTTTTDASGNYTFTGLAPGTYRVVETQPAGYLSVASNPGNVLGAIRGTVLTVDSLTDIALLGGEDSVQNDFGEARPVSISGHVYHDANNNGQINTGEAFIPGAVLQLIDATGTQIATATTDTNGFYLFTGLRPGVYTIREVQPAGYLDGLDTAGSAGGTAINPGDQIVSIPLNKASGQTEINYDFGELLPGSIKGRVFADPDRNCEFGPESWPIADVTVWLLDANGNRIRSTKTNADGRYEFTGLAPGTYGVEEIQPVGYFHNGTKVGSGGGDVIVADKVGNIPVGSGQHLVDYDFCEVPPSKISGYVYVDANRNGIFDSGEKPIAGVTMNLLNENDQPTGATTTTNADGFYEFAGLYPGAYGVSEEQPAGYFDGWESVGTAGGFADNPGDKISGALLAPGQAGLNYNFGELLPALIQGRVFVDRDFDCVFDPTSSPLAGVTIWLTDANGVRIRSTTTDVNGYYTFNNLEPGTYGVEEVQPDGIYQGGTKVGTAGGVVYAQDVMRQISLNSGQQGLNYDFCEREPGSISGKVWLDVDVDCTYDPGEQLLAGVTIWLLDADGNRVRSTTTDGNGAYIFAGLAPGVYGVEEIQPVAYYNGCTQVGTMGGTNTRQDVVVGINLPGGRHGVNYDFGERLPGSLSGYVFQDGPAIVLPESEVDNPPADLAWRTGRLGARDAGDAPIAGVRLRLGDARGNVLKDSSGNEISTVTDKNGYYRFDGLAPGLYTVLQEHPSAYLDGFDTQGSTGGLTFNLRSETIEVGVPDFMDVDPLYDAIARITVNAGMESRENNFSEVQVTTETMFIVPPPGPLPVPPAPVLAPPPLIPFVPPIPEMPYVKDSPIGSGGRYYTWHLSVVDAGLPRTAQLTRQNATVLPSSMRFDANSWRGVPLTAGRWKLHKDRTSPPTEFTFGVPDGIAVTGDFNGDGITDLGIYLNGEWFIDLNGNGVWDDEDLWARLGHGEDKPVTGDWDGDGKTDIGIFGPAWAGDPRAVAQEPGLPDPANAPTGRYKNIPPRPDEATNGHRYMKRTAHGIVREDLIDHVFYYGVAGDQPITGDWNGAGTHDIGIFRGGRFKLDSNGNGRIDADDVEIDLGVDGKAVVGDWNADGIDDLGVFSNGTWYLDSNGNRELDANDEMFAMGEPDDQPVVGDWDGDGRDDVGTYQPTEEEPVPEL